MASGTYGRQPKVSPDGTQFVFAGYDGSRGSGTEAIAGKRRAIAFPNTVEILNAQTLKRTKLNVPSGSLYDDARFDASGKYIFISKVLDEKDMRNPGTCL
jgi:DNA-binding beta-propeller fold protein YncE